MRHAPSRRDHSCEIYSTTLTSASTLEASRAPTRPTGTTYYPNKTACATPVVNAHCGIARTIRQDRRQEAARFIRGVDSAYEVDLSTVVHVAAKADAAIFVKLRPSRAERGRGTKEGGRILCGWCWNGGDVVSNETCIIEKGGETISKRDGKGAFSTFPVGALVYLVQNEECGGFGEEWQNNE